MRFKSFITEGKAIDIENATFSKYHANLAVQHRTLADHARNDGEREHHKSMMRAHTTLANGYNRKPKDYDTDAYFKKSVVPPRKK